MIKIKWSMILLLTTFFSVSILSLSWAELRITPSIGIREEYNDNIFLTPSDEEDDFITSVNPAINLTYNTGLLTLSLDYGLNLDFYMHNSEENEIRQLGRLESTISPYRDIFFIRISDVFERVSIDERRQVILDNILVNTTDSNRFIINPYMEYPLSKTLKVNIGYIYENVWYKEEEGDDTENHSATLSLLKEISPKITASLSYTYLIHRPDLTEEYDRQDVNLGIDYQLSPNLSLAGNVGQTWFDFEKTGNRDSTTYNIEADYKLTEIVSLSADYSLSFFESVDLGTYKRKGITGGITYDGKITTHLTVFRNIDTYTTLEREDRSTGVTLGCSIPITPKMTGRVTGRYAYYKFLPEEEKVKRYGLGLFLDYTLRMTTVTLGYTYNLSDSNVDNNDYRNNMVWLQARFTI